MSGRIVWWQWMFWVSLAELWIERMKAWAWRRTVPA